MKEIIIKPIPYVKRIQKDEFIIYLFLCRILYIIISIIITINYNNINEFIQFYYINNLSKSYLFHHESFEPFLASISFAIFIFIYRFIDYNVPILHKYRIQSTDSLESWKNRSRAFYEEVLWYIVPIVTIDCFVKRRVIPSTCPTFLTIIIEVMSGLIMYDLLFFIGHYYMHFNKNFYQLIHSKHHSQQIIRATDSIRHTFLDGSFDVLCSVFAINILKMHVISRSIYNVIAIYLIVEAHCGYSMPWMLCNIIPFHILGGPNTHDIHHKYSNCNYHKFFTYLDYLFNTLKLE